MVRHVLLLKFRDGAENKEEILCGLKRAIEELPNEVTGLVSASVHTSPLPSSRADAMIECVFESEDALAAYKSSPQHLFAAAEYIKPYSKTYLTFDTEE